MTVDVLEVSDAVSRECLDTTSTDARIEYDLNGTAVVVCTKE